MNCFQRAFKLQKGIGNKDFFKRSDRFIKLIITRLKKLKNERKTHNTNRVMLSSIYSMYNIHRTQKSLPHSLATAARLKLLMLLK